NERRIDRIRSCALCAGNARKGNGWLLRHPAGAKAWDQGGTTSCDDRCAGRLPKVTRAAARRSFIHEREDWRGLCPLLRFRTEGAGERAEAAAQIDRGHRNTLDFVAEEIVRRRDGHHGRYHPRGGVAARVRGRESLRGG